jgi:hypothetical protein
MNPPYINQYRFGYIQIDGIDYNKDVIVRPDQVLGNWCRISGHELDPIDLELVLESQPEILIIGTGSAGRMKVPDRTQAIINEAGIKFFSLPTKKACTKYNQLREKGRTCAALHLTC